jgi:hypothetical protein
LRQAARESLDDPRIANYFSRSHVDKEAVFQAIDRDDLGIFLLRLLMVTKVTAQGENDIIVGVGKALAPVLSAGIAALLVFAAAMSFKYAAFPWQSAWLCANIAGAPVAGGLLGGKGASRDVRILMAALAAWWAIGEQRAKCAKRRKSWLDRTTSWGAKPGPAAGARFRFFAQQGNIGEVRAVEHARADRQDARVYRGCIAVGR